MQEARDIHHAREAYAAQDMAALTKTVISHFSRNKDVLGRLSVNLSEAVLFKQRQGNAALEWQAIVKHFSDLMKEKCNEFSGVKGGAEEIVREGTRVLEGLEDVGGKLVAKLEELEVQHAELSVRSTPCGFVSLLPVTNYRL
jgi:hypothetical protein